MNAIVDGFTNVLAALGMANPKQIANSYTLQCSQPELDAAYRTSTWFGKIVDIPPDDATREWRAWQAKNDQIEKIEAEEKRLQLRQKVRQALIWARLYGGSVIVPGGLTGKSDTPVRLDSIREGSIKFLSVLDRYQLSASGRRNDPLDPYFGQPDFYSIDGTDFHPSRIIRFTGRDVPNRYSGNDGWGDSIWNVLHDAVTNADLGASVIGALLTEAKIDVIHIPEFMSMLGSSATESTLIARFQMAQTLKSVSNALILDKDDEWQQKQITWTGLPDVVGMLLSIMAGAADIPVTRLIGTSAKGLNATGEGDLHNYYDSIKAKQELKIEPEIAPFDEMLIRSALGNRPAEIWYKWKPLFQLSEAQQSEIDKREAETANLYATSGLVPIEALEKATQNRMIESGRWPGLEAALAEVDEETAVTATDAEPKSLYLRRNVKNAEEIKTFYARQGLTVTVDQLHITIIYSKRPVDWFGLSSWGIQSELKIEAGGPRRHALFGPPGLENSLVLMVKSEEMEWRNRQFREIGADFNYDEYQPHITLRYEDAPEGLLPEDVEPFQGDIVMGPEVYTEIDNNGD